MADELIGHIVEGTITNVTNFGAFVSIDGGEEGLVHISEIANEFITDINQFVKMILYLQWGLLVQAKHIRQLHVQCLL